VAVYGLPGPVRLRRQDVPGRAVGRGAEVVLGRLPGQPGAAALCRSLLRHRRRVLPLADILALHRHQAEGLQGAGPPPLDQRVPDCDVILGRVHEDRQPDHGPARPDRFPAGVRKSLQVRGLQQSCRLLSRHLHGLLPVHEMVLVP